MDEVLEHAAAMDPAVRWETFQRCGTHDVCQLPRMRAGGDSRPPDHCMSRRELLAFRAYRQT